MSQCNDDDAQPAPANARPRVRDLPVSGWSAPGGGPRLPPHLRRVLVRQVGAPTARPPIPAADTELAPSTLAPATRAALESVLGAAHVRTDRGARLRHAGGAAYVDLVRRRVGQVVAPDAVVLPGSPEEVGEVLKIAAAHRVAVVPFGGGTSVVGGVEPVRGPFAAVLTLDLRRLDRVLEVDATNLCVRVQAGIRGPALEAALAGHGLTLGHFPQSFEHSSVGGWVAARSAGQASTGYGRIEDLLLAARVATPSGELRVGHPPASAAGPDLRALVAGGEGVLGVITEATLRVHPAPGVQRYEGWVLPAFDAGLEVLRSWSADGLAPAVARLSDEAETASSFAMAGHLATRAGLAAWLRLRGRTHPALLITGYEGSATAVRHRRRAGLPALRRAGALRLGRPAGAAWQRQRFTTPQLRDSLLDAGFLVETLETAAGWRELPGVRTAVVAALHAALAAHGTPALVGCHVSHVYPGGGSLYVTVLARQVPGPPADAAGLVAQWTSAKRAATDALLAAGGTLTHHHGVGLTHVPWIAEEAGERGLEVLRALKACLDPVGVLNPGKLIG